MTQNPSTDSSLVQNYELVQSGYKLRLDFSPDATVCTARYEAGDGGTPLDEQSLRQFVKGCRVCEGIHEDSIQILLTVASARKSISGIIIAQTEAMQPGEDGRLEIMVIDSLEGSGCDDDGESGTVCLKNVQQFRNVDPGDMVAVIHPPGAGTAGRTVQGESIPAQPGVPLSIVIGANARLDSDGATIYAESAGRVCYLNGELSIEDVFTVKGDVDYHVGNIYFNGFVEITGDVLDGFSVKSTKGIKILGVAGSSEISSGGDIELCGMNGQGTGKIDCGGNLTFNFCNDSTIVCERDVTANVEMRNCNLRCMGTLWIKKGTFGGGRCIVLSGMETGAIGTRTSLPTTVMVGMNYRDFDETERINKELVELNEQFTATPESQRDLTAFVAERNRLSEQLQLVRGRISPAANPRINVQRVVYENARITLGRNFHMTREEIQGPVSLIPNTVEGGIRQLPVSSLSIPAEELEQAAIIEEAMKESAA